MYKDRNRFTKERTSGGWQTSKVTRVGGGRVDERRHAWEWKISDVTVFALPVPASRLAIAHSGYQLVDCHTHAHWPISSSSTMNLTTIWPARLL